MKKSNVASKGKEHLLCVYPESINEAAGLLADFIDDDVYQSYVEQARINFCNEIHMRHYGEIYGQ